MWSRTGEGGGEVEEAGTGDATRHCNLGSRVFPKKKKTDQTTWPKATKGEKEPEDGSAADETVEPVAAAGLAARLAGEADGSGCTASTPEVEAAAAGVGSDG
jgi:hypothetical protein